MNARLGILAFALLLPISAAAGGNSEPGRISVYGTAVRQVAPNQMNWRLVVRNVDQETARGAVRDHAAAVGSVLDFLKGGRVAAQEIQTSGMQLGENWKHIRGERTREGFYASTDVTFKLEDISKYAEVWTGLADLASVSIESVELDHADRIDLQNEARIDAVLAAREKAQGIADALGARLGAALSVEEDLLFNEGPRSRLPSASNSVTASGPSAGADELFAPGSIPIRSRVKVEFTLITTP
ncbi:MAG: SIMPL domain-containing protein [Krumholzibacteria bacterium]|nr:SIMPL domain-containing protein [Candidatus Krumholzibacteria bacterium]